VSGDSLIDAESASRVGTIAATGTGEVNRRDWQRWAAAVGDHNPLYFDPDYARANGFRDIVCPPLFLQYGVLGVTRLDGRRPDGSSGAVSGGLAFPRAPKRMAGGESFTFHPPLAKLVVEDAVVDPGCVNGLLTHGVAESAMFAPATLCEYLGLALDFGERVDLGGATSAGMVGRAATAVELGVCDAVQAVVRYVFYPRTLAPGTLANDLEWREIDGAGVLYTFTVSRRPTGPPWADALPQLLAVVQWDAGPRSTTELVDVEPSDIRIGMRVRPVFSDVPEAEITLLKYRRA
jgi:uncharacterized OB-fold protein